MCDRAARRCRLLHETGRTGTSNFKNTLNYQHNVDTYKPEVQTLCRGLIDWRLLIWLIKIYQIEFKMSTWLRPCGHHF